MFCQSCGRGLADALRFCDGCGADVASGAPRTVPLGQQVRGEVHARSRDAWRGLKLFARSPVGGLPESFALFDARRALQVGFVFAIGFELAILLSVLILKSSVASTLGRTFVGSMLLATLPLGNLTLTGLIRMLFIGLVPFASLVGASALARAVFRGKGSLAGDVYTAGAVLLPWGCFALLTALLGVGNVEVIVVLFVFALTYSILMLYSGCSRISGIPEVGAAPAIPIMLLASAWITKIVMVALW